MTIEQRMKRVRRQRRCLYACAFSMLSAILAGWAIAFALNKPALSAIFAVVFAASCGASTFVVSVIENYIFRCTIDFSGRS